MEPAMRGTFSRTKLCDGTLQRVVVDLSREGWSEPNGDGHRTKTYQVPGVLASHELCKKPLMLCNNTDTGNNAVLNCWDKIVKIVPGDDTLTFFVTEIPDIRLPISILTHEKVADIVPACGKIILHLSTGEIVVITNNDDIGQLLTRGFGGEINIGGYTFAAWQVEMVEFGEDWDLNVIPDSFLSGFVVLVRLGPIPEIVNAIRNDFLRDCGSLRQQVIMTDSVLHIGNGFMFGCSEYNAPMILSKSLLTIGDGFMALTRAFNQPLEIPSSVTFIDVAFLHAANSFVGPLRVRSNFIAALNAVNNFSDHAQFTLSTNSEFNNIFTHGVDIYGLTSNEFTELGIVISHFMEGWHWRRLNHAGWDWDN
jgi:hypothetical protein